jgi:hypothetical protein
VISWEMNGDYMIIISGNINPPAFDAFFFGVLGRLMEK